MKVVYVNVEVILSQSTRLKLVMTQALGEKTSTSVFPTSTLKMTALSGVTLANETQQKLLASLGFKFLSFLWL